jgi:hypothetical protein
MTLPLKHARASGSTSVGDEASPSSSKAVGLDALPSADALRTWVHRPHAVACCFITDVVRLRTLAYTDGGVSQAMRGELSICDY